MRWLAIACVASIAIIACVGEATNPPQGPGTGFPCGYHGHSCGNQMCCDDNEVCGDARDGVDGTPFSGCAAGYCCFVGDPNFALSVARPKKQYREGR